MNAASRRQQRGPVLYQPPVVANRVPPHDLDYEAALLEACICDPERRAIVLEINEAQHFYSEANGIIFGGICELEQAGADITVMSVVGWLRDREKLQAVGGAAYVAQLVSGFAGFGVARTQEYAERVKQKWVLRQLIARCQRISAEGYGDVGEIPAFVDSAEQMIYDVSHAVVKSAAVRVNDILASAFAKIQEATVNGAKITGVSTGYERYDHMTAGLHGGDLTIVAARPGMGKTSFVMNVAVNVASPKATEGGAQTMDGVAVFSLEMPREPLGIRMVCSEGRVDLGKLRQGFLQADDWRRLTEAGSYLGSLPIWIDDTPGLTLLGLRSKIRRMQSTAAREKKSLGLVIIDYLQLMTGRADAASREQEISELSRGLKLLAKELKIPIIVLSQLNREVEKRGKDKRPQLSDLRESGAIEQDADNIIFIYRDEYYNPETTNYKGMAEMIVAKQRSGATGKFFLKFTAKYTRFDNLAPCDYPQEDE